MAQTVKNLPAMRETWVSPLWWEDLLEKGTALTIVFLPGELHGQRSLMGAVQGVTKESVMTEAT